MSTNSTTLSAAVTEIDEQAARKEAADNIDAKVATAEERASNLVDDVEELADAVADLQFYRQVVQQAFTDDLLEQTPGTAAPPSVTRALDAARDAVDPDRADIVDRLVQSANRDDRRPINELRKKVTGRKKDVEDATDELKEKLRSCETEWQDRIKRARQLQNIIGDIDDSFSKTVGWMEDLITEDMWDTTNNAASVVEQWHNAQKQWEGNQSLQGLDAFQQTHGLSDDAIDAVKRLSNRASLRLADVDADVLDELKNVEELAEAVELSI